MSTKTKLTLPEIYRLALIRGLTAKQAGAEFGVSHESVAKMKTRLKLPSLISEYEFAKRKSFKSLTTSELTRYVTLLTNTQSTNTKEYTYAKEELSTRETQSSTSAS